MTVKHRAGDAVFVVDVQRDFCPGGALAVPEGDQVIPVLNAQIAEAAKAGLPVLASRDWHPRVHPSFEEWGGPWPTHCVQDTTGAGFAPSLALPEDVILVTKGTRFDRDQYSAFDETGLAAYLASQNVSRLWVGGLALDVCVLATVLDARRAGFEVVLIPGGSRAVDPAAGARSLETMAEAGVWLPEKV